MDCDCRSTWIKEYWKKLKLDASNEIAKHFTKWLSIDTQNDNHLSHRHHSIEKDTTTTTTKFNKNQLDEQFIINSNRNLNQTYEQLIDEFLNRNQLLEDNLNLVKCRDQNDYLDNDLFLVKKKDENFDDDHQQHQLYFSNSRFSLIYLNKMKFMKNDRKLSILDSFHKMRSCLPTSSTNSAFSGSFKLNKINYLAYFIWLIIGFWPIVLDFLANLELHKIYSEHI